MAADLALEHNVPLAPFTTFGIGGPADLLTRPQSADQLAAAVQYAEQHNLDWFVLGTGANILVGDQGFRGLVIKNEARHFDFHDNRLTAESGVTIAELIDASAERGLSGLEHYQDIPSSLGGALWQNLHFLSYPHQRTHFISEIVVGADVLSAGQRRQVDAAYFEFGYDTSILHRTRDVVLTATLQLAVAPLPQIATVRKHNAAWRQAKHPPGAVKVSAGSVFKKIDGVGAGRLIDAANLKGYRVGGAEVSRHHANYVLNVDQATARDVRAVIAHIQKTVAADSGYRLEPEISFIGEF